MSQEHEHVEGDPIEASRRVFRSNAEMLQYMNGQWHDDPDRELDALFRYARKKLAEESNSADSEIPFVTAAKVTLTFSGGDLQCDGETKGPLQRWKHRISRIPGVMLARAAGSEPGSLLLRLSQVVFGRRAHDQIFAQIVADMREEVADAKARGATIEAWFARVRGTYAWVRAVGAKVPIDLLVTLAGFARKLIGGA